MGFRICESNESGGPEEFHLQSPTDPCLNLSIHTALIIQPTIVDFAPF